MYIDYGNYRRKRNRSRVAKAIVILVLVVALVGIGGYFLADYYFGVMESQEESAAGQTRNAPAVEKAEEGLTSMTAKVDPDMATEAEPELSLEEQTGVFGLWYKGDEAAEPEPVLDELGEEIWMGNFVDNRERVDVKGIYMAAGYIAKRMDSSLELIDDTELNTMIIDIKSEKGYLSYHVNSELGKEIGAWTVTIPNIRDTIAKLKEHNVYLVARIVCMLDPILCVKHPELALQYEDGTLFKDNSGKPWLNPYEDGVWDYIIEIAKDCVEMGFDEVNLDYVRFSTDKNMNLVVLPDDGRTRMDVITDGIRRICEEIKPMGAFVSADVYGTIINSSVDAKIVGQSYFKMSQYLDYICPMIYPSHYGNGYYNLDIPDCHPYELVYKSLLDSKKVLYMIDDTGNKAIVRPWLQDFTAGWVKGHLTYGKEEVRAQIDAVYDSGHTQWALWNAAIDYTKDALLPQ